MAREEEGGVDYKISVSLLNVIVGVIAKVCRVQQYSKNDYSTRYIDITLQFRLLLTQNYKTEKKPSWYSQKINISLSYLNESVKKTTGFPISYWIHQEIILEAKRLLYFSKLTVKEIAYELGYSDHTYFSRLFTKIVEMPPLHFRKTYNKMR